LSVWAVLSLFPPSSASPQTYSDAAGPPSRARKPFVARLPAAVEASAAHWGEVFDQGRLYPELSLAPAPTARRATPAPSPPAADVSLTIDPAPPTRGRFALIVPPPVPSPAYERTFRRLLARPERTDRYDELIVAAGARLGLDPRLVKSIVAAESEFVSRAVSPAGARGLMQVMPETAEMFGVPRRRLFDPEANVLAGAAYLRSLFEKAWRRFKLRGVRYSAAPAWVLQRIIAAYHAGPRFLTRSDFYRSTRQYVRKVLLYYRTPVTDIRRPKERKDIPAVDYSAGL